MARGRRKAKTNRRSTAPSHKTGECDGDGRREVYGIENPEKNGTEMTDDQSKNDP